jgi:hypothetical protein
LFIFFNFFEMHLKCIFIIDAFAPMSQKNRVLKVLPLIKNNYSVCPDV